MDKETLETLLVVGGAFLAAQVYLGFSDLAEMGLRRGRDSFYTRTYYRASNLFTKKMFKIDYNKFKNYLQEKKAKMAAE